MDPRLENWGGPGYATYEVEMKVSGGEKNAANMTANESSFLMNMLTTQFGEQQTLLNNTLIPQLRQMATNPQGFGAQAMAAMRAQTIGTIGGQLADQLRTQQQQFATQNMAGLGSGVQAALGANLAQGAAGAEATNLQNLAVANAQAQMQQQQFGLSGLSQASQLLGQAPEAAGVLQKNLANQFNQQYTMSQQGGFWGNLARGALTAAGTAFLGPLGGMAGNALGSIFGGGGGALPSPTTGLGPASFGAGSQGAMLSTDILGGYQPAMPTLAA